MLQAPFRHDKTLSLYDVQNNAIFNNVTQLKYVSNEDEDRISGAEFSHIIEAPRFSVANDHLDESQCRAGNAINSDARMVAIEGPFGTGKTALIADALARRPWLLRQNAVHVSTLIITPSNKAALNGALALRKAGVNFKYACSKQYYTIMVENGMPGIVGAGGGGIVL